MLSGSRSKSFQTLNFACCLPFDKYSLSESCTPKIQAVSTESDILTVELVLDLLGLRFTMPDDPGINHVIVYFCTS